MRLSLFAALVLSFGPVSQGNGESETFRKISDLVDDETWLVARVDLSNFDLAKGLSLLNGVLPEAEETGTLEGAVRQWQTAFRNQGGKEIFFVYGGNDFPQRPCFLVPLADWREGKDLLALFPFLEGRAPLTSQKVGKFLAVGTKPALAQLANRKPADREDLLAALGNVDKAPFQVAFSPSASARKIIAELAPELPKDLGGGPTSTLTAGLKWVSVGVDAGPRFTVQAVVQATDAKAANLLAAHWGKLLSMIGEERLPESIVSRVYFKWLQRVKELLTPRVENDRLELTLEPATELPQLAALGRQLLGGPERARSMNNLKQIMIAIHSYHDVHGHLPANVTDKDGKPLLSWRVLLLPYLEHGELYQKFKLDEPWDGENNQKLVESMPKVFKSPKQDAKLADKTTYLAPFGKGLMWEKGVKVQLQGILDGTSNTIAVVEADDDRATIWTKPDDLPIDADNPAKGLLSHYTDGFLAALGDGSVRFLRKDTPQLHGWFTRAGGEVLTPSNPKSIKK